MWLTSEDFQPSLNSTVIDEGSNIFLIPDKHCKVMLSWFCEEVFKMRDANKLILGI